ncbi:hypothetical protein EDC96DRAFT_519337 [Choanephora cucurbitarum]|nr:hypothetical protein EDC96DRAFT_519337 [Choanephora cucurbitarum]
MHRRKCVNFDNMICERCHKLDLDCVFKVTEKPDRSYKPGISSSKRNKLYETIWYLEEETENIQFELSQLKMTASNQSKPTTEEEDYHIKTLPASSKTQWALTISNSRHGIQLQSNIRSMTDLASFLEEAFNVFIKEGKFSISHPISELDGKQTLPLTFQSLEYEGIFRPLFSAANTPRTTQDSDISLELPLVGLGHRLDQQIRSLKQAMIRIYFNCYGLVNPFLIHSYFYPILCEDPDSLMATTIVSMVAHLPCIHVDMSGFPFTRAQFADACRTRAKRMLEETLFESEPALETCISLYILIFSSLHSLKNIEGRFQSSICWQMMVQLRFTYLDKSKIKTTEDMIKAECYKRLYYLVRYIEFTLHMIYDNAKDFSHVTQNMGVGLPTVLPCEMMDDRLVNAVLSFQTVGRLIVCLGSGFNESERGATLLMVGVVERIPSHTIRHLEKILLELWETTPPRVRLGYGPYRLIDPASVEACTDPCILRCNLNYYLYWIMLHTKLMEEPQGTDLTGAAFGRIDGDRALIIVSICSDALARIFKVINAVSPCTIEYHWMTLCVDVLRLLTASANIPIRKRAEENLAMLSSVVKDKLNCIGDTSKYAFSSQAPYLLQIKKAIVDYMDFNL